MIANRAQLRFGTKYKRQIFNSTGAMHLYTLLFMLLIE